jgi:integrase/recombinase XerD
VFVCAKLRKELAVYMVSVCKREPTAFLFNTQKSKSFSANTMCQLLIEIYRNCGIVGAASHSGRRTFATSLSSKGASIRVLMKLMGHRNISTTIGYVDASDDMLRRAVELV